MRSKIMMVVASMCLCSCSLAGLDGSPGKDGADGAQGPQGPQGPQGDMGPAGEDAVIGGGRLKPIFVHGDDGTKWHNGKFKDAGLGGVVCVFQSEILGVDFGGTFCLPPDMPIKDPGGQFADPDCQQPLIWNPSSAEYILSDSGKIRHAVAKASAAYWLDYQDMKCKPSVLDPSTLEMYWQTEEVGVEIFVEGVEITAD